MKPRKLCVSILVALLTSLSILPAHAATVTLHSDNFADILTGNSTSTSGSSTTWTGAGRYIVTNAYQAGGAVRIGNGTLFGSITTTNLTMQAGTLHVQVSVKGWTTVEGQLRISVAGQQSSITYTAVMAGSFEPVSADFVVPAGTRTVTFSTSAKRCFLDDISITETVSDTMVPLGAPVAYAPTATNDTSFTASWSSVANAESYQLSVYALTVVGSVTNASPISGSPFTVATGTTTRSVTGLTQDSLYRYNVVAVGNGTTTGNSPASNPMVLRTPLSAVVPIFTVTPATVAAVQELSPVNFTITATVGGSPATVTYTSGLPSGASYTFSGGAFAWTPALGQANTYTLVFSVVSTDLQTYTQNVSVTVNTLPLTAPTGLTASNITDFTFDASWNSVAAATQGYVVDAWYGSSSPTTLTSDLETFFEIRSSGSVVAPMGWTFTGLGSSDKYSTTEFVELKLDFTGEMIQTKRYPKAVTSLTFKIRGITTASTGDSVLNVYGTTDGVVWTLLTNNVLVAGYVDKSIELSAASGFTQFKFDFIKGNFNLGIGNIAAVYEGAGAKFLSGWEGATTLSTLASISGAKPGVVHYVRVGSKNATETKYTTFRLKTLDAPKVTVISVR